MSTTFRMIEVVGASRESYEDAIKNAIEDVSDSLEGVGWFEIVEQRGRIENGKVIEFQIKLKVAFQVIKG